MEKPDTTNTIVTAEPTFFVETGFCGSVIKAASWDEAMSRAAEYMAEFHYSADERGKQRISYTVYRLPAGTTIWDEDHISPADQHICEVTGESRDATHVKWGTAPDCPHGEHEFLSTLEHEGGLKENPGTWGHGGACIIKSHCMHCGLPKTDDYWDDATNQYIPTGITSYGEIPDDWDCAHVEEREI